MNSLSTRRRHPLAAFVVLFLALGLLGSVYAAVGSNRATAAASASTADAEKLAEGQKLFQSSCSSCHGMQGQGVQGSGPSLSASARPPSTSRSAPAACPPSRSARRRRASRWTFNQEEIDALAAYVGALGAGPAEPGADQYTPATNDADLNASIARGGVLFRTNCSQCHNFAGSGGALTDGKYAPPLRTTSAKHMYEAMLTGPQNMPIFNDNVMSPQDKKDIIAYLMNTRTEPAYGGLNLGSLGPVSEGAFIWIFGLGAADLRRLDRRPHHQGVPRPRRALRGDDRKGRTNNE